MEQYCISLEQAKRLKELGFDRERPMNLGTRVQNAVKTVSAFVGKSFTQEKKPVNTVLSHVLQRQDISVRNETNLN